MPTTKITEHKAERPGALDGHQIACSCGLTWTTSLSKAHALREAMNHEDWHARNSGGAGQGF